LAQELTDSAVIEIALSEHLGRDGIDEGLIVRRLDSLGHAVERMQHDIDILSQAVAIFVKYAFRAPPPSPTTEATQRADGMFTQFLRSISNQIAAGARLAGDVQRASRATSTVAPGSGK
jgi:hypothetical protein